MNFPIFYLKTFHTFFARAKKVPKKARPVKSLCPRSLRIFRELQNSRVFDPFRTAAILFPKNPRELGAFQRVQNSF